MTNLKKAAAIIVKGTAIAALGTGIWQLVTERIYLNNMAAGGVQNLSGIIQQGSILMLVTLLAGILSMTLLRTKDGSYHHRTYAFFGLAGLAAIGTSCFRVAENLINCISGTATTAEMITTEPLMNTIAQGGMTQDAAIHGFALAGTTITIIAVALIAAVVYRSFTGNKGVVAPAYAAA